MKVGDTFMVRDGLLTVVEYKNYFDITVVFKNTGYKTKVKNARSIIKGSIKDKLKPTINNIGYIGEGPFKSTHAAYQIWVHMLNRCYNKGTQDLQPSYIGCSVCSDWHNFQNFALWYENNYPTTGFKYQLDKDILIPGNKVYGPEFCKFVSQFENLQDSNTRKWLN